MTKRTKRLIASPLYWPMVPICRYLGQDALTAYIRLVLPAIERIHGGSK